LCGPVAAAAREILEEDGHAAAGVGHDAGPALAAQTMATRHRVGAGAPFGGTVRGADVVAAGGERRAGLAQVVRAAASVAALAGGRRQRRFALADGDPGAGADDAGRRIRQVWRRRVRPGLAVRIAGAVATDRGRERHQALRVAEGQELDRVVDDALAPDPIGAHGLAKATGLLPGHLALDLTAGRALPVAAAAAAGARLVAAVALVGGVGIGVVAVAAHRAMFTEAVAVGIDAAERPASAPEARQVFVRLARDEHE